MSSTANLSAKANSSTNTAWRPQRGPQTALVKCPYREILYGGARGGGKTDGVLGKWGIKAGVYGSGLNAVFFRRTMPSQDDVWERAREIYGPVGAGFNEAQKAIRFSNGGRIRFRPLERVADAEKYQGQNLSDAVVEEAGQYPDPKPIDRLFGALRSPHGVPTQLILTANPGGPGQTWIKARYVDPAPQGMSQLIRTLPNGAKHKAIYIPSKVWDNRILLENDPNYVNNLYLVGSAQLVRAWLNGDWDAVEGAFFDCWDMDRHVLTPFEIPRDWRRFRSGDWGSARPFSFGWWALVPDWYRTPMGAWLPRGAMVRYREWYGCIPNQPNTGLKLDAEEVADGIVSRDQGEETSVGPLDPAAFTQDGGPSIAERMATRGARFRRADNRRVGQRGAMGGWDMMRHRLVGEDFGPPYGKRPMIYCFSTCTDSIRTIPALQHDEDHPEDVDTDGEDHAGDEWRYACMSRPWVPKQPVVPPVDWRGLQVGANRVTLDEFIRMNRREREERI